MKGDHNGLYQTSYKYVLQTSTIEAIRQSIQSLQDYLESGNHTDSLHSRTYRERQNRKAIEWATQNGKQIIAETDFLERWQRGGNIRGGENLVYFDLDADDLAWAIKMNELTYHQGNMAAFADRLVKSSEYFPDTTLEVIGMVTTRSGVKPLLRQLFVVTNPETLAFPVHIRTELEDRGFTLLDPDNEIWLSPDRSYYFSDPGQNNVLVDENGELAFIDVIFRKVTPDQFRNDYPGLARLVSGIETQG
ncbi:MAG: hypothetical protein J0665_11530 [Deltaproteobacteria bacterium]|jgi:hypothetical protein|nr:hypothetical protein [Deltaproteobacteria bacterium]